MKIRIHERRQHITNAGLAQLIASTSPRSFRKAQDLLVAVQKYRNGKGGWFSTDKSRRRAVEAQLAALAHSLAQERYSPSRALQDGGNYAEDLMVDFLSVFSEAFPNWQNEYEVINEVLGR